MKIRFFRLTVLITVLWLASAFLAACQPVEIAKVQAQAAIPKQEILFSLTLSPDETYALEPLGANPSADELFLHSVMGKEIAYYNDDLASYAEYFAENTLSMPPDFEPTMGKARLQADMQAFFDEYEVSGHSEVIHVEVHGNYATRILKAWDVLTPKAGGEVIHASGSCVAGWEKINGEWKITWEIWNSEPLPAYE
jgi:ketosteroid isomerase-like protein